MLGIIGGTGFNQFDQMSDQQHVTYPTPYGEANILQGIWAGKELLFLARHGGGHNFAPHQIPYRANIKALFECGVTGIIAFQAVGAVDFSLRPGDIVVPLQLIDYTFGRDATFFDGSNFNLKQHVDFTYPFDDFLRSKLINTFEKVGVEIHSDGVYGVTQGPRLETAAEIERLRRDGCTIVGMTAMPEAILARELEIPYVSVSLVVNMAPGVSLEPISIELIQKEYKAARDRCMSVLECFVKSYA